MSGRNQAWENIKYFPFNPSFPVITLVSHVKCVADVLEEHNPELHLDREYLITGALFHDFSKMVKMGSIIRGEKMGRLFKMMPDSTHGAILAICHGLDSCIANIILSYTGRTGALPTSAEATLLRCMEYGLADVLRTQRALALLMGDNVKFDG